MFYIRLSGSSDVEGFRGLRPRTAVDVSEVRRDPGECLLVPGQVSVVGQDRLGRVVLVLCLVQHRTHRTCIR